MAQSNRCRPPVPKKQSLFPSSDVICLRRENNASRHSYLGLIREEGQAWCLGGGWGEMLEQNPWVSLWRVDLSCWDSSELRKGSDVPCCVKPGSMGFNESSLVWL